MPRTREGMSKAEASVASNAMLPVKSFRLCRTLSARQRGLTSIGASQTTDVLSATSPGALSPIRTVAGLSPCQPRRWMNRLNDVYETRQPRPASSSWIRVTQTVGGEPLVDLVRPGGEDLLGRYLHLPTQYSALPGGPADPHSEQHRPGPAPPPRPPRCPAHCRSRQSRTSLIYLAG